MKSKRPYYSKRTKKEVVFDYENGRASAKELARLYGILGFYGVQQKICRPRSEERCRINFYDDLGLQI